MTADGFHAAVKTAFARAASLEGDELRGFLSDLREREPKVAAEVAELLGHHDPEDTFLESSVLDRLSGDGSGAEELVGARLGRYRLTGLIASGSMGAVYEAEQDEPRRAVAVKVLRAGAMSPRSLRRFRYEAEVLGRLRHPGVAQIYEAGTHADGALTAPYFAMELVPDARPVTRYVRDQPLELRETLALFAEVCHAVHHGHQKGVIHRDLKPANILVGAGGRPKVIDFGVARAIDADPTGTSGTVGGQVVGTLQYMSPEQLRPSADDIDVRTDVYALGVVLFELVCGEAPQDLTGLSFVEAADAVRRRPMPLAGSRRPEARGDLEAIIAQATDADRRRRYQSAEALAEDVERYLRSEPVSASRPGLWRQFQLLARRRAGTVAAISAVAAALVGATVVSVWFSFQAENARAAETLARIEAQASADRSSRAVALLRDMIAMGERAGSGASVADMLSEAVVRLDGGLADDPIVEASLRLAIGQTLHGLGRYAEAESQLREALRLHEATLGPKSPEALQGASALALTLAERGRLAEALNLSARAAQLTAQMSAGPSPRLGEALAAQAEVARRIGRPAQAASLATRAMESLERGSAAWARAALSRAETQHEAGRAAAALESATEALEVAPAMPASERRRAMRLAALSERSLGRVDEAEPRLAALAAGNRVELGAAHPETLLAAAAWHETRAMRGPSAAARAATEALGLLTESAAATLAPERPVLAELRAAHARCLRLIGRDEQAERVLRRRVSDLALADTADRPSVVSAVLDLVEMMLDRGAAGSAAALASEVRRTSEMIFPAGCVPRARAVVLLAEAERAARGRTPAAAPAPEALAQARETLARELASEHAVRRRAEAFGPGE